MCYIAIKIGNHLNREIKYLLNMESKRNSDGFAFTGINLKDKGVKIHKTMNYKTNEIKSEIKKDFFMSHLRFGTNGTKTVENIHLWKKGN